MIGPAKPVPVFKFVDRSGESLRFSLRKSGELSQRLQFGSFNLPAREVQLGIGPTKDGHEPRTANCER
jgi:acyl CoA:acetate/3-ketoacid CoA transferase alpha subunit